LSSQRQFREGSPGGIQVQQPTNTRTLPPPSPVVRRSSTQDSFRRPPGIRKSATLDYPDFSGSDRNRSGRTPSYYEPRETTPTRFGAQADYMMNYPRGSREVTPVQQHSRDMFMAGFRGDPLQMMTMNNSGSGREQPSSYSGRRTPTYSSLRRNSTASGSNSGIFRDGSFDSFGGIIPGITGGTSTINPRDDFSRYSSILDDKHDWGFSTLSRRNSKKNTGY